MFLAICTSDNNDVSKLIIFIIKDVFALIEIREVLLTSVISAFTEGETSLAKNVTFQTEKDQVNRWEDAWTQRTASAVAN